jgi:hypothetical protein
LWLALAEGGIDHIAEGERLFPGFHGAGEFPEEDVVFGELFDECFDGVVSGFDIACLVENGDE